MRILIELPDDPLGRLPDGALSGLRIEGVFRDGYDGIAAVWDAAVELRDRLWDEAHDDDREDA